MTGDRMQELLSVYRDELLNDTLPFWINHSVDRDCGGFMFALDRDGSLIDTDKGIWQQGRFTWLLGHLYNNVEQSDKWLELAEHGVKFIDKYGFDPADGRMWFHVTREGVPIRKRRYAFSESFAAIAYAEYARAADNDEYAAKAKDTFRRFVEHDVRATFPSKFTDARPMRGLSFPMITIVSAQVLRDAIDYDATAVIDRSIEQIELYHCKPEIECVVENVGPNGEIYDHFDGRMLTPGHAIEGAWFILNEGKFRNDSRLIKLGCSMLDWTWKRGWDQEYGGILYYNDIYDKPIQEYWHDMKFWWPQNETLIATLLAYQLTGEEKYAQWHEKLHQWTYSHFPDPEYGEWFGYLHRDGRVSVPLKGNIWKGPFHLPRMQLVCWKVLEEMCKEESR